MLFATPTLLQVSMAHTHCVGTSAPPLGARLDLSRAPHGWHTMPRGDALEPLQKASEQWCPGRRRCVLGPGIDQLVKCLFIVPRL
jgi:hypothetical protein